MQPDDGLLADLEWLKQLEPGDFFSAFDSHLVVREPQGPKNLMKPEHSGRVIVNLRTKFDELHKNSASLQNGSQTPKLLMSKHLIPFFKDKANTPTMNSSMLLGHSKQQDKENRNPNIAQIPADPAKNKRNVLRKREKESPPSHLRDGPYKEPRVGSLGELRIDTDPDYSKIDNSLCREVKGQEISAHHLLKRSPVGRVTPKDQYFPLRRDNTLSYHTGNTENSLDNLLAGQNSLYRGQSPAGRGSSSQLLLNWQQQGQQATGSNSFLLRKLIRDANFSTLQNNVKPHPPQPGSSRGVIPANTSREGLRQMLGLASKSTKARDAHKGRSFLRPWEEQRDAEGLNRQKSYKQSVEAQRADILGRMENKGSKSSLVSEGSQLAGLFIAPRQCQDYSLMGVDEPSTINQRCNLLKAVLPTVGRSDVSSSHLGAFTGLEHQHQRRDSHIHNIRGSDMASSGLFKSKNHKSYSSIGANCMTQLTSGMTAAEMASGPISTRESKSSQQYPLMTFGGALQERSSRVCDGVSKRSLEGLHSLDRQTHPNSQKLTAFAASKDQTYTRMDKTDFQALDRTSQPRNSFLSAQDGLQKVVPIPNLTDTRTNLRDANDDGDQMSRHPQHPNPQANPGDFVFITDERQLVNNVQDVTSIEKILSKAKVYGEKLFQRTNSSRLIENATGQDSQSMLYQHNSKLLGPRSQIQTGSVDLGSRAVKLQLGAECTDMTKKSRLKTQVQELLSGKSKLLSAGERYTPKHLLLGDLMHQGSHSNALREKANKILYGDRVSKEASLERHPSGVWARPSQDKTRQTKPELRPQQPKPQLRQPTHSTIPTKLLMRM